MEFDIPPVPPLSARPEAPIADLSYRNYDGPLHNRAVRWWTIAAAMIRLNVKPLSFKIVAALAVIPYIFIIVLLYLQGAILTRGGTLGPLQGRFFDSTVGQKYAFQFYNALGYQLLYLLILTLIAGAGSIASDNRNNALLIYLSKPITKSDYLLGKWMGLFLTLFMVAFGPALLLYLYCLFSYTSEGFLHDEPYLILHILENTAIVSALFTSIMLGLSAWSKSPRIAGAILAGVYFASQTVAFVLWGFYARGDPSHDVLLLHSSIGGVMSGLSQAIFRVTIHTIIGSRRRGFLPVDIAPPPMGLMLAIAGALLVLGIVAARWKIKAVEVVNG